MILRPVWKKLFTEYWLPSRGIEERADGLFSTHILRKIIDYFRGETNKRHWVNFNGTIDRRSWLGLKPKLSFWWQQIAVSCLYSNHTRFYKRFYGKRIYISELYQFYNMILFNYHVYFTKQFEKYLDSMDSCMTWLQEEGRAEHEYFWHVSLAHKELQSRLEVMNAYNVMKLYNGIGRFLSQSIAPRCAIEEAKLGGAPNWSSQLRVNFFIPEIIIMKKWSA